MLLWELWKEISRGGDYMASVMRLRKACFDELDVQFSESIMASEMSVS